MSKAIREPTTLFRPFLVAGIILVAFGIFCIWMGPASFHFKKKARGSRSLAQGF
jgi:hypothetical protein